MLSATEGLAGSSRDRLARAIGVGVLGNPILLVTGTFGEEGVAIRSGHHCCQPLMQRFKIPATARMSFYLYNSEEDIDAACKALEKVYEIFKVKEYLQNKCPA